MCVYACVTFWQKHMQNIYKSASVPTGGFGPWSIMNRWRRGRGGNGDRSRELPVGVTAFSWTVTSWRAQQTGALEHTGNMRNEHTTHGRQNINVTGRDQTIIDSFNYCLFYIIKEKYGPRFRLKQPTTKTLPLGISSHNKAANHPYAWGRKVFANYT